ncbi:hypothetical protein ACRAWD_04060 [Caulobacter segnis]
MRGDLIRVLGRPDEAQTTKGARLRRASSSRPRASADPAPVAQTFFVDEDVKARIGPRFRSRPSWTPSYILPRLSDSKEAVEQTRSPTRSC